jgi:acyl-CoA hydrolase
LHGHISLGISVDIAKAATETASIVVAQVNSHIHGDGFIHLRDLDYIIPHHEPLLEYSIQAPPEIVRGIEGHIARIIEDGSTIQVSYGMAPDAVLPHLADKKHLGAHTELLSDGIVELMKKGVVDNTQKANNPGKTIAAFCMGCRDTYGFLDENPAVEFKRIEYTNNPMIIARNYRMTAINSAMEIDLTGQATAESLGGIFYSGIGGQGDFMRGAIMALEERPLLLCHQQP